MAPTNTVADLFSVKGLVAVITGGGSGLGLYAARALDANGAKAVYIVGRREQTLQDAAKTAVNGTIKPIVGDASSKESLREIAEQVRREQGYVNLLFANAGIAGARHAGAEKKEDGSRATIQELQQKLFDTDIDDYTQVQRVNNSAVFYTAVAFLDLLDAGNKKRNVAQDSQIIVTSSVAAYSRILASSFAYSTSKAAVTHLVKMLSSFLAVNQYGIRVNLIAPGLYPSEMTAKQTKGMDNYQAVEGHPGAFEGAHAMPPEACPTKRTGSEEDFAGTILFMASRAGAYLNGETLLTDGGRVAVFPSSF